MNLRKLIRRKVRGSLYEWRALRLAPQTQNIAAAGTQTLRAPGPARIAVRPLAALTANHFRITTSYGAIYNIPALAANQTYKLGWVEEGELMTVLNNSGGAYLNQFRIGVVDAFGRFQEVWRLTGT